MKNERKRTINAVCIVLIAAYLIFFMVQTSYLGQHACLLFDENGLPNLLCTVCGIIFGALLIVLGRNLDAKKASLRKLFRLVGILEIICAVLYYVMTLVVSAQI